MSPQFSYSDLLPVGEDKTKYRNIGKTGVSVGIYFIDYLRAFQTEVDEPEYVPEFLKNHKNIILENAGGATELTAVSAKYLWMANYHNTVISEFKNQFFKAYGLQRKDLEVSVKDMPMLQSVES